MERRANITVGALMGTGAATLGLALFGLAGLGSDLRAADAVRTTPPISTQDLRESLRQERRSHKWDGTSPAPSDTDATPSVEASPPLTTPTTPTTATDPQKEL